MNQRRIVRRGGPQEHCQFSGRQVVNLQIKTLSVPWCDDELFQAVDKRFLVQLVERST